MAVRRSMLMMPANVERFVDKAYTYGADTIMLDLEDAVPQKEKETARDNVKHAIKKVSRGKQPIFVRVNNEREMLEFDIAASVCRDLYGIVLPKAEDIETLKKVDVYLQWWEQKNNLHPGHIKVALLVETAKGILCLEQLIAASTRIESILFGSEDFCSDLGVQNIPGGQPLWYALSKIVLCCKANHLHPIGVMGSVAEFRDLDHFRLSAEGAMRLGCEGGLCIHPSQIPILNQVFSPGQDDIAYALKIVEAYNAGIKEGKGAVSLDGRMIDAPIYKRAQSLLETATRNK